MPFSHNLVAFNTILRKEIIRFLRIWSQTLLPPVITQSLYFIIFGGLIGSQVRQIQGISYMAFLVPGLVMMAVITNSFANVVSSFFGSKFQRNIEELLVSPTPNWVIIAGFSAGGIVRGIITGLIVFAVSLYFNPTITIFNPFLVTLFIVLTSAVFALGGLLNAIFATKFDDTAIFTTFILTPLTYLGGIFYSVKDLPQQWQIASQFNPILYMVNGFRYGFYGISDVSVTLSVGILISLILILAFLNWYLLKKGYGMKA